MSGLKFTTTFKMNLTKTNNLCTKKTPQPVKLGIFESNQRSRKVDTKDNVTTERNLAVSSY